MLLRINSPIMEGETSFRRIENPKYRKEVYQGGTLHLERIYASGGFIISVFNNYATNAEESKYDTIETAMEKYHAMVEMRENSPEWVDEGLMPAILKAVRAAQRQISENRGIAEDLGDPSLDDIEEECGKIEAAIAQARAADPELDKEMTQAEMVYAKSKVANSSRKGKNNNN